MPKALLRLIRLQTITDDCLISIAENSKLPFRIKRLYYIYDVRQQLARGHHAHKKTKQILFCLRGTVRIVLDDGTQRVEHVITSPSEGVFLGEMIWHEMHDMTNDTILLVLASEEYNERDYIRDYQSFKTLAK